MRPSLFLVAATLALTAQASWFGGSSTPDEPAYAKWNAGELRAWLHVHNVPVPERSTHSELKKLVEENWNTASAWTYDQYASAQKSFSELRDSAFETWDESRLRSFLLEHGVVAPQSPREHLVLLAKQKYLAYQSAASSYSSVASAAASTAVYGDTNYQMSKSAESLASQASAAASRASAGVVRSFDDSKDYVYSTWSDNQLRSYLEEKGLLKTKAQKQKNELLQMMHDAWGKVADPVWDAWSDSYIHHWLVSHNLVKSDSEKKREALVKLMQKYYYSASDTVYSSWSDSQLKKWLVDHGIMKSDAQASRDKMLKLVADNYLSAKDTFWSAWSDNQIRTWLVENGYMRSDAQYKRDQLIKLADEKYTDQKAKAAEYLKWPDARLRAYLREQGISEEHLPGDRPGLLQEIRIRWVQTQDYKNAAVNRMKEIYYSDNMIGELLSLIGVNWQQKKAQAEGQYEATKRAGEEQYDRAKDQAGRQWEEAKKGSEKAGQWAQDKKGDAKEKVGEKLKVEGQKMKGEL
ncbi:hypothetical protein M413DRAFT_71554 [Hebeloma cylindrosporum]|uniref:Uncharacterized protein n=1 Tax=Hebeloma cylindrosporum TaxID=76867 RepID=A0A0C2XVT3_HEBCY|nr:hypothetical protein M413DRAFT_71554 [Hebeloma cylindrosporum h7]